MSDNNKPGLGVFLNKKPKDANGAGALSLDALWARRRTAPASVLAPS